MAMKTKTVTATAECGTEIKITVPAGPLPSNRLAARLKRAFELVANGTDWKAPIDARVTDSQLKQACLTISDVREAVYFYTATAAKVTPSAPFPSLVVTYHVEADGYRRGPAGG